jgi:hypothetical protein
MPSREGHPFTYRPSADLVTVAAVPARVRTCVSEGRLEPEANANAAGGADPALGPFALLPHRAIRVPAKVLVTGSKAALTSTDVGRCLSVFSAFFDIPRTWHGPERLQRPLMAGGIRRIWDLAASHQGRGRSGLIRQCSPENRPGDGLAAVTAAPAPLRRDMLHPRDVAALDPGLPEGLEHRHKVLGALSPTSSSGDVAPNGGAGRYKADQPGYSKQQYR